MIYNAEILKFSVYNWEDSKYKRIGNTKIVAYIHFLILVQSRSQVTDWRTCNDVTECERRLWGYLVQ